MKGGQVRGGAGFGERPELIRVVGAHRVRGHPMGWRGRAEGGWPILTLSEFNSPTFSKMYLSLLIFK